MMIEKIMLDYLNKTLSVPAYMEEPENEEITSYVLIEKTGGSEENHINSATLAIQSYAESLYLTAILNEEVKKAVNTAIELDSIARVELNSDYNFTDTTKKKYRYQAVYEFKYY